MGGALLQSPITDSLARPRAGDLNFRHTRFSKRFSKLSRTDSTIRFSTDRLHERESIVFGRGPRSGPRTHQLARRK
jgi:hypothetical protein